MYVLQIQGDMCLPPGWHLACWAWLWSPCFLQAVGQQGGMTGAEEAPETLSHEKQLKEQRISCWREWEQDSRDAIAPPELVASPGKGLDLIYGAPENATKIKGWKLRGGRIQPLYEEELLKTIREIQNRKGYLVRLMSSLSLESSYQGCVFICQEFVKGILYWVEGGRKRPLRFLLIPWSVYWDFISLIKIYSQGSKHMFPCFM